MYLNKYKKTIYSLDGEDGIIEYIFQVLNIKEGFFCEFGAWDGKFASNSYNLIKNCNWGGLLIEGDEGRFQELLQNHGENKKVRCHNGFVGWGPEDSLDNILEKYNAPINFDLLSIDIDGNDYHVWDATKKYKPKVVFIEYNLLTPVEVDFVQEKNMQVHQGHSIKALVRLGKEKGYELIGAISGNAIFVEKEYFPDFNISDNSIDAIWPVEERDFMTYMSILYDGTIMLHGHKKLVLQNNFEINTKKMQVLPKHSRFLFTPRRFGLIKLLIRKIFMQKHAGKLEIVSLFKQIWASLNRRLKKENIFSQPK